VAEPLLNATNSVLPGQAPLVPVAAAGVSEPMVSYEDPRSIDRSLLTRQLAPRRSAKNTIHIDDVSQLYTDYGLEG